jgi:hypothetical protein
LKGATTAGTSTYATRSCIYAKIGRVVHFSVYIVWTAHTGSGNLYIELTGLPNCASTVDIACMLRHRAMTFTNQPKARINAGTANVQLTQCASNAGATNIGVEAAGTLRLSGTYHV